MANFYPYMQGHKEFWAVSSIRILRTVLNLRIPLTTHGLTERFCNFSQTSDLGFQASN